MYNKETEMLFCLQNFCFSERSNSKTHFSDLGAQESMN